MGGEGPGGSAIPRLVSPCPRAHRSKAGLGAVLWLALRVAGQAARAVGVLPDGTAGQWEWDGVGIDAGLRPTPPARLSPSLHSPIQQVAGGHALLAPQEALTGDALSGAGPPAVPLGAEVEAHQALTLWGSWTQGYPHGPAWGP